MDRALISCDNFKQPDVYSWSPQGREDGWGGKGKKEVFILYVLISSGHFLKTRANIFSNLMKIINPQV